MEYRASIALLSSNGGFSVCSIVSVLLSMFIDGINSIGISGISLRLSVKLT